MGDSYYYSRLPKTTCIRSKKLLNAIYSQRPFRNDRTNQKKTARLEYEQYLSFHCTKSTYCDIFRVDCEMLTCLAFLFIGRSF